MPIKVRLGKIYCLKDPETLEVRYVGFTRIKLNSRLSQHKHEALKKYKLSHCYNWFRDCYKKYGKIPVIELLEDNIVLEKWEERENFWINSFPNLTNQKSGGIGVHLNTQEEGRQRSISAKKKPVIQLDLLGNFSRKWDSIIEAEQGINGEYTGNIYRAVKSQSTAFNYLWVLESDYNSYFKYTHLGKHWKPVYVFCPYTLELLNRLNKSTDAAEFLQCKSPRVTQAIKDNSLISGLFFIRNSLSVANPPKPNPVYCFNNRYYINFNKMYRTENMENSLGYQKKIKSKYLVEKVTPKICRLLRENFTKKLEL